MAQIYNKDFNILIKADLKDVREIVRHRVPHPQDQYKSIGWNNYIRLSISDRTLFPISKDQYHKLLDMMKENLNIQIRVGMIPDTKLNYPEDYGL